MSNKPRTYVMSGSASGIGRAPKELLLSQGHRVIAEVVTDLGTDSGRDVTSIRLRR